MTRLWHDIRRGGSTGSIERHDCSYEQPFDQGSNAKFCRRPGQVRPSTATAASSTSTSSRGCTARSTASHIVYVNG